MKKKNIIIIVVIAVALLLIIGGIIFVSSGEKEPKEIKENRDYKTVVENAPTTEGEMSSVEEVQESFEEDAKDIGFEKAECKDGNCLATNKGYTNADQEDVINVAKDEYGDPTMVVVMHFHKNDCTADNVYTTFYTKLQKVADNALGVYQGAVVVTEVKTGRILAMVSKPGFNPNEIESLFKELSEDEESSVLLNRATQGLYPPGSIFKVVTTLEYLRQHNNDLSGYSYQCNGSFAMDKIKISCFNHKAHGYETYEDSVTNSCNSSFANIGVGLDLDSFSDTLDDLLFGKELPIDLPSSISSYDLIGDGSKDAIIQSSFGQGKTITTPLQMNLITCAIANGGKLMKPQVIDSVKAANGTVVKQYNPTLYKALMTQEESQILTDLMIQVVEVGTASKLNGLSYSVAGKTGSAEYDSSKTFSHSWFTGFAPAENPEIAVTIIMEEAGTGSSYAVPVAKRIFDAYFGVD